MRVMFTSAHQHTHVGNTLVGKGVLGVRRAWSLIALWLAVLPGPGSASAVAMIDHPWTEYRSKHFTVISDLPSAASLDRIRQLELFHEVVCTVAALPDVAARLPMEFYFIKDLSTVRRLAGAATVLGFMRPTLRVNYMVASPGTFEMHGEQVMFHEYVHLLLRNAAASNLPRWYDEGTAEYFSTFAVRGPDVLVGANNNARINELMGLERPFRIEQLLVSGEVRESALFGAVGGGALRGDGAYALAWLLVHYLHAGGSNRELQMHDYLRRVADGESSRSALGKAFGEGSLSLARHLERHLERLRQHITLVPAAHFHPSTEIATRAMPRYETAYRLGYLAVSKDPAFAREMFNAALSERPGDPHASVALAVVAQFEEHWAAAVAAGRAAFALAPEDPLMAQELADMLTQWCESAAPPAQCPALRNEAIGLYGSILSKEPERLETKAVLGAALLEVDDDAGAVVSADATQRAQLAREYLVEVHAALPWATGIVLDLGRAYMREGDYGQATPLLARALRWAEDADQLKKARAALAELDCRRRAVSAASGAGRLGTGAHGPASCVVNEKQKR